MTPFFKTAAYHREKNLRFAQAYGGNHHAVTRTKEPSNTIQGVFIEGEKHPCTCDFNTVIMRIGCQCGGI